MLSHEDSDTDCSTKDQRSERPRLRHHATLRGVLDRLKGK
jgi:hypothetical protein